ncbi:MAG: S1C family serine protease [Steroidobacteraceae bacterium]
MAAYPNLKQLSGERVNLVENAAPRIGAVVLGRRALCGILWRDDLMVTAAEAIGGAERVDVRFERYEESAEVVAVDLGTDVAVLRVPAVTGLTLAGAPPAALRVGEAVALVGREVRGPIANWGSVRLAGPAWTSRRGGAIAQRLEIDVRFNAALEGAAVVDMEGTVAAMAVPGPFRRVLGIPAETIEKVVTSVEKHGRLPQPYIGVRLQPLWLDESTRAQLGRTGRRIAAVSGVDAGSPAADAHIELGDLLLTVDGVPAENAGLAHRIASLTPGQAIELAVLRGGKPLVLNVRVGERPHH